MNQPASASQPLEFTPVIWVGLLVVGLIGLMQVVTEPNQHQSLAYLEGSKALIVRSSGHSHRFPILGVEVQLSDGWTYLSVAEDSRASAPTFVHKASQSIVQLKPYQLRSWPPPGAAIEIEAYGDSEWEWAEVDHRRVGRWRDDSTLDLVILALTHQPHGRLNSQIRAFCRGIQPIY